MHTPLVSVICLCYNQHPYVKRCLESVWNQTYQNIELIIVDDFSTDGSKTIIKEAIAGDANIQFIDLKKNIGNTGAFNLGLEVSNGLFIIDLAADDILNPERIEIQVGFFLKRPSNVGVIYSDAEYINHYEKSLGHHFKSDRFHPYDGDIYCQLITTYFIPPPTMMVKREVFEELEGYDSSLTFEDFDFWIRSSRNWAYAYQAEVLTKITKHANSHSTGWYKKGDKQLYSTYQICKKIYALNQSKEEHKALATRVKYEVRQSVFSGNHREAELFLTLLSKLNKVSLLYTLLRFVNKARLDFSVVRHIYHKLRFG